MKRWLMACVAVIVMLIPSVGWASGEIRLTSEADVWQAEIWLDGMIRFRLAVAEAVPVWLSEDAPPTVWLLPRFDGGMLKIIVR